MTHDAEFMEEMLIHSKEHRPLSLLVDENLERVRAELEEKPEQFQPVMGVSSHMNLVELDSPTGQALKGLRFVRNRKTVHLEEPSRAAICNTQLSTEKFKPGPLLFQRQCRIFWKFYTRHDDHAAQPFDFCSGCKNMLEEHIGSGNRIGRLFLTYWSEGLPGLFPEKLAYAFVDETDFEGSFKLINDFLRAQP